MMFRTAIALLALAAPVFAQHGAHGGSIGSRGAAGHGGFSGSAAGHGGFSGSPGFSRSFASPAPAFRYGAPSARNWASGSAGFHGAVPRELSKSLTTRASVFPRTEIDSALVALRIIRRAPAGLAIGITTASTGAGGRSTIGIPTTIRRGRDTDTPTSSIPDSTTGATPILAIPAALKTTAPDTPVLETATLDTTPLHTIRAAPLRLIRLPTRTRAFARPISRPRLQRR